MTAARSQGTMGWLSLFAYGRLITAFAACLCVVSVSLVVVGSARAGFGLSRFDVAFTNSDGSPDVQAGSHPFAMSTAIHFISQATGQGGEEVEQAAKDVIVGQVPGFVGAPAMVPACSDAEFLTHNEANTGPSCPDASAIGVVEVLLSSETAAEPLFSPVYNIVPPPGRAAKIGFWVQNVPVPIELGVRESAPYNVVGGPTNISQLLEVIGTKLTLWGVPADPAHDPLRGKCVSGTGGSLGSCPAGTAQRPFLTVPRSCQGPLASTYAADSWLHPGGRLLNGEPDLNDPNWLTGTVLTHDASEPPAAQGFIGCGAVGFEPVIEAQTTSKASSSPTGLDFKLDVNNEGLENPAGVAQSDIKKATVTLPEAVSVNPALAEGLTACSETGLAKETIQAAPGEGCPQESKIGTVEVETPLLSEILKGSLYLATPYANPFKSLLGLYVVVKDPETGVLLKLPGKVSPDPTTGRLTSVFDNLPQLPFSHFRLHFREGQRSPLATPDLCGTYTTTADLVPWAKPESTLHDTATFQITTGINGAACPTGGTPPFKPGLSAGTINNQAGAYSPLSVRITRNDGEQEITGFSSLLPPGVTANLTGIPFCSDAQIAAAEARSHNEKGGAEEQTNPSCPPASQIGHTSVGVGVGSVLAYDPGKLYMAGPFEGAPFSVVAITAAKVGPFDLGTVIVHLPLNIDPVTAQVSIPAGAADQIPHIIEGIVVHVRDIRVYVDRPNFTLNPTNCGPLKFSANVIGSGQNFVSPADDVTASVSNPFEAANCANLAFKPGFKVSTSGRTSRAGGASLTVKLAYPNAPQGTQANIRSVKVDLPKQLPSRLTTLQKACTDSTFNANPAACPAASRVGSAKAITPILPVPLQGPAYFVSHGGAKFPELIVVLQGYGVTIDLHGETFISRVGITSSTFRTVPDQPVTSFELTLPQGPFSALAANGNLCSLTKTVLVKRRVKVRSKGRTRTVTRKVRKRVAGSLVMPTAFTGQNGAVIHQNTPISVTGCPKQKKAKPKKK